MPQYTNSPLRRRSSTLTALASAAVAIMLGVTACGSSGEAAQSDDGRDTEQQNGLDVIR